MQTAFAEQEKEMFSKIAQFKENLQFARSSYGVKRNDAYNYFDEIDARYKKAFYDYYKRIEIDVEEKLHALKEQEHQIDDAYQKLAQIRRNKTDHETRILDLRRKIKRKSDSRKKHGQQARQPVNMPEHMRRRKEDLLEEARREAGYMMHSARQEAKSICLEGETSIKELLAHHQRALDQMEQDKLLATEDFRTILICLDVIRQAIAEARQKLYTKK